jgi:putative membrane protein insertion efficiency factor
MSVYLKIILIILFIVFRGITFEVAASESLPDWQSINAKEKVSISSLSILKALALSFIRLYQLIISPQQGDVCNFQPSCSHFAFEAIKKYGIIEGILMASDRLQRCHYWAKGKYYPSPNGKLYDPVKNHCLKENLDNLEYGYYYKMDNFFDSFSLY